MVVQKIPVHGVLSMNSLHLLALLGLSFTKFFKTHPLKVTKVDSYETNVMLLSILFA